MGVAVGIVPGRPYCKAQRKVAPMFLRGSVHVPELSLHISLQLSSAFAPGVPASVHAHRIFLLVQKVFPVDILSALLRLCNRVATPGPIDCKPGTIYKVDRQRFVKDHCNGYHCCELR
ncbi:hypothetical protein MTO96_003874 [Rhipicephalus appendiculatus]